MEEEKKESTCPKCDNLITNDCKKCPKCGFRLNKEKILLNCLIILVILVLIVCVYFIYEKGIEKKEENNSKKYNGEYIQVKENDSEYILTEYVDYDFEFGKYNNIYGNGEYLLLEGSFHDNYHYMKDNKYLGEIYEYGGLYSITTDNNLFDDSVIVDFETKESYFTTFLNKGFSADIFYDVIVFSEEYFASRKDNKDGKYGVLNKDGSVILDYEYDNIFFKSDKSNVKNPKYFYIEKDGKVGIASKNGKIIVEPIYEYSSDFNITLDLNNNYYFTLLKGEDYYIFKEDGKKIFEFKKDNIIRFNYTLNKFERINVINNIIDNIEFYDADGKLIKKLNLTEYKLPFDNDVIYTSAFLEQNDYWLELNLHTKNILLSSAKEAIIINNDLNVRKVDNIYYTSGDVLENWYRITDKFYITYSDRKYSAYTIDGKLIAEGINKLYTLGLFDYVLCKDYDTKCALLNREGKLVTEFTYDYILTKDEIFYGTNDFALKDGNNYILYISPDYPEGKYKKLTCKNEISGSLDKYSSKNFIIKNDDGSFSIYDYDCNEIVQKKYDNIKITDSEIIVAQVSEEESNYSNFKNYDIIIDNKIINYKNPDSIRLNNFIGEANNMLFFRYGKRLYSIDLNL